MSRNSSKEEQLSSPSQLKAAAERKENLHARKLNEQNHSLNRSPGSAVHVVKHLSSNHKQLSQVDKKNPQEVTSRRPLTSDCPQLKHDGRTPSSASNQTLKHSANTTTGPDSPEQGIDQCIQLIFELQQRSSEHDNVNNKGRCSAEIILAVHRINMCFLAARSYSHATDLAERAVPECQAPNGNSGTNVRGRGICLITSLLEIVGFGEPHSVLALNCLSFLTCSPKVLQKLTSFGLMPMLLGQLRNGNSLEAPLQEATLSLLVTLIKADGQDSQRPLLHRHLDSIASVSALFLGSEKTEDHCRALSVQLLQEMAVTFKGAELIKGAALVKAMDQGELFLSPKIKKQILVLNKLANALVKSSPGPLLSAPPAEDKN